MKNSRWEDAVSSVSLSERSWEILRYRFGHTRESTLEELGKLFNVSRERIRQLQNKALKALVVNVHSFEYFLNAFETLLEGNPELVKIRSMERSRLCLKQAPIASEFSTHDLDCLIAIVRALTRHGCAEKNWPRLSFLACNLPPRVMSHAMVRDCAEATKLMQAKASKESTYRELARRILREAMTPLHWSEIAHRCETLGKRDSFSVSACYNRLQADKKTFVRVGQGTYALSEWGLNKNETLSNLIAGLLFDSRRCMSYGELLREASDLSG